MAAKKKAKNFMTADRAESRANNSKPKSSQGRGYQYGNDSGYPAKKKSGASSKMAVKRK